MVDQNASALADFDPEAPLGFGEDYVEYVPPIEKPEDYDEPAAPVAEAPAPERIEATFRGMPGNEKLLLHVIDYCREERDSTDVHDEVSRFVGTGVCTYAPEVVCANLVRAGALAMVAEQDADEAVEEAAEEAEEAEDAIAEAGAAAAVDADEPAGADGAAESSEVVEAVGAPPAFSYRATADGLAVVDAQDPEGDRLRFLEEGERYLPVYRLVLEACGREEGATKKDIDTLVDHHELCREPRRYSGFFVKGLEGIDAIAFDGAWKTTEVGRDLLAGAAFAEAE